jgi:acyl-CoA thioester hydrolase
VNDQPSPRRPALRLDDFPHRSSDLVRFADLDPQGHVNQAAFATYFETGRVAMFRERDLGIGAPGKTFVLVRQEIDYLKELHWPGNLDIGTAIAAFGRSSFTVMQVVFLGPDCAAVGRSTMVCIDLKTRRPDPLPQDQIARLSPYKYRGAAEGQPEMKHRPRLAELMKNARGIVKSDVPDLASNPKHMEGFGRDRRRNR